MKLLAILLVPLGLIGGLAGGHFLAPPAWRVERPLRLRFRLHGGERRAVTVGTPRLTVEYR